MALLEVCPGNTTTTPIMVFKRLEANDQTRLERRELASKDMCLKCKEIAKRQHKTVPKLKEANSGRMNLEAFFLPEYGEGNRAIRTQLR